MSLDDVVCRLRTAAHDVPPARFDSAAVLSASRRALRRRRRRQSAAGAIALGLVALTVASPVHVPGVGTVTMPASQQIRGGLGIATDESAPPPGVDLGEFFARLGIGKPTPQMRAREVKNLQLHVLPVVAGLRATWFEVGTGCDIIEYSRGTFSQDGTCGGRPGEQRFDGIARADLDRIIDARARSDVPTDELRSAQYSTDGTLESAAFLRAGGGIKWNYSYIYSPNVKPPEPQTALGPVTVTPIGDTGWWFEQEPND